jgi:hypothetical protein
MSDWLAQHGSHDAVGGPLDELQPERSPDVVAHVEELLDTEVVHQPELVVRERAPGIAAGNRSRGFAAVRIALIHLDAAEVVLERLHRVEHRGRPVAHPGVQAPSGGDQQREAGAGLLVTDPDVAPLVERHGSLPLQGVAWCARRVAGRTSPWNPGGTWGMLPRVGPCSHRAAGEPPGVPGKRGVARPLPAGSSIRGTRRRPSGRYNRERADRPPPIRPAPAAGWRPCPGAADARGAGGGTTR